MQSKSEDRVDEYIEIMKSHCEKGEIVKYKKQFDCVSTVPYIVRGDL